MDKHAHKVITSSKNENWCTPQSFLDKVYQFGDIELDPCSNIYSIVDAKKAVLPPEDGLQVSWSTDNGIVFANPPYGRKVKHWVQKAMLEHVLHRNDIIMLIPARVDTKWFQEVIFPTASAICFWKGRIKFVDGTDPSMNNPATFPSAVVYWGQNPARFLSIFQESGHTVVLGR